MSLLINGGERGKQTLISKSYNQPSIVKLNVYLTVLCETFLLS